MTDLQAIADRVEIEALRGEFTDAAMMRDRARKSSPAPVVTVPSGLVRECRPGPTSDMSPRSTLISSSLSL